MDLIPLMFFYLDLLYSDSEELQQYLHLHDLITNPKAIKGRPKNPKHPQHALQATAVHFEKIAKLNRYAPSTKQTKSHKPYR